MKRIVLIISLFTFHFSLFTVSAQSTWPMTNEAKPGTRWWWQGSAVDSVGITAQLTQLAQAGIGAVEITPIYGVQGNEANEIPYLSPRWMEMLRYTCAEGQRLGIQIDMNNGTGWPFGGPEVQPQDAACKAIFKSWHTGEPQPELTAKEKKDFPVLYGTWTYGDTLSIALYIARTRQQVKRAAPGGEGYVIDHLDKGAVQRYLSKFEGIDAPIVSFFNDSYEVYGADWTPTLLDEFASRRGYRLEDHFPVFLNDSAPDHARLICDYRETMSDMLLKNFTLTWREWAHQHGALVRNQAHGSPANLLDLYAAVDIPEIEGFGLSDFGIRGLRTDSLTRPNYSDLSMLKYPASAAHFYGKPIVTAETFTWLTEHFCTSLSQCKPDFDLMMTAGVNRCYFHGTTYSPPTEPWPGRLFYAAMEMSPINPIWHDAPAFFEYITRIQSWMQYGQPDNDLLVYLPIYDIWSEYPGRLLALDIHKMDKVAPRFISAVNSIYAAGYDLDYVSDRMIASIIGVAPDGQLIAPSGIRYKALVLPQVQRMPERTQAKLDSLAALGATIIRIDDANYAAALAAYPAIQPEPMKSRFGLKAIRRTSEHGYHYFISNLQPADVDAWIPLAVPAASAQLWNPMTGNIVPAAIRHNDQNQPEVQIVLASGESVILVTSNSDSGLTVERSNSVSGLTGAAGLSIDLTNNQWKLEPLDMESFGTLKKQKLSGLQPWTSIDSTWATARGTARYTTTVHLSKHSTLNTKHSTLDLGDLRESAVVYINGKKAGTVFAAPFRISVGEYLRPGKNTITIDVTGLPANYVAEMDRRGIIWRRFKDANIANLKGGRVSYYGNWDIMPAGLNSTVKLIVEP